MREKQIDLKGMRAYEELSDIPLPIEQEKMMDIICDAWEDCQQSDCRVCTERPHRNMRIMACTALKYTRLLREAGYRKQSEGEWIFKEEKDGFFCSLCDSEALLDAHFIGLDYGIEILSDYCPWCGAKMSKGERK